MGKEEISIKVNIGDRFYPLKINSFEEEQVRKAARVINEKARYYRENFSVKDQQDALSMTALEFATEVLLNEKNHADKTQTILNGLSELESLIDRGPAL